MIISDRRFQLTPETSEEFRKLARKIKEVNESMVNDTDSLEKLYKASSDKLGAHSQELLEMITILTTAVMTYEEVSDDIYKSLCSSAEMIDAYLRNTHQRHLEAYDKKSNIVATFNNEKEKRIKTEGTNQIVLDLYNEYKDAINIADYAYTDTACYNPVTQGIYLNYTADLHNPCGKISAYFHECGHFLDDMAGNGHTWLSSDTEYVECLKRDYESYITAVMLENQCDRVFAENIVSEELNDVFNFGISDIYDPISNGACQGLWGHSSKYWETDPSYMPKEAFANMFEASIGSKEKLDSMKKYFPTAYQKFEKIIKNR